MIDNYVFQPAIFSNSINAHPLEIFIVILVAGSLGGVLGMIAAIPVYSFLRIVFREMNRELRWLERLKQR
jgi:predicted PurR-regulated permease PerM